MGITLSPWVNYEMLKDIVQETASKRRNNYKEKFQYIPIGLSVLIDPSSGFSFNR